MNARDFGITDDPYEQAAEDVASYRDLSPFECWDRFVDLMRLMEILMRAHPPDEWRRLHRIHQALDDPGRWWERVPSR